MMKSAAVLDRRAFSSHLGRLAALGLAVPLAGCGFQLRQPPNFAFKSIYTSVAPTSVLGSELKRNLAAMGSVELITEPSRQQKADVILDVLQELRQKIVVGTNAAGQVREFQLRLTFRFRLRTPQGKELIPDTEMIQQRDISFNESAVLAKETEEALLYRSMQTDIVHQLMRRLAAVKEL
jgi:LPS-assembly lipoprotein